MEDKIRKLLNEYKEALKIAIEDLKRQPLITESEKIGEIVGRKDMLVDIVDELEILLGDKL